jgi:signal transduction histidine kinase
LYQCHNIIEAHGGKIEASSVEGSGTVFTVWFADSGKKGVEGETMMSS